MTRLQKVSVLADLAALLRDNGSWCGETHLQKATYFLEELLGVPLDFEFIIYKHGPFSFDLRDELTAMRADGVLELQPHPAPYGPGLIATESSQELRQRFPVTLHRYGKAVKFVAQELGAKGSTDLERLGTALYVIRERPKASVNERVARIIELKPHVTPEDARNAVEELDRIAARAPRHS
jgi:uncharacterized protein YwgA